MRYFFIMNPGSGGGKSEKKIKKILAVLDNMKINYDYKLTNCLEDACCLSLEANKKGYDVITAVGGDGTINRVINGFYDSGGKKISNSKLAVIHTGTSPDFCKSYCIPQEINQALNTLFAGKSKRISLGKITYTPIYDKNLKGMPLKNCENVRTGYFACCANIGIGASVARAANSGIRKYLGDFVGTFVALLQTLLYYRTGSFTVSLDGERKTYGNVCNIAVGKTTYIASGIKVKNELSAVDDRFYNLIIKELGLTDLIGVIRKIYSGKRFVNSKTTSLVYAKAIEVYGSVSNPEIEFDGDPRGYLPCIIETAHDYLELICEVF